MWSEENKDDVKTGSRQRSRSRSGERKSSMASGDPDAQVALKMRGLPWSCEEAEVLEFFEGFKIVEEEGVKFGVYEDGRKSGNACVKFETPEECARAKSEKEGEKIGHRWINLLPARASDHDQYLDVPEVKIERPPPPTESDVVFCGNLNDETTAESMEAFFNGPGQAVTRVRRMEGRPFGFVEFSSMDAAAAAVDELSGQELDGNVVRINLAQPKRGGGGGREVVTESDTCFVGNLSPSVEEEDLEELFDEYDYSEIRLISGKGFAFVSFEEMPQASKAMEALNGKDLKGQAIRVNLAKPKAPRDDGPPLEDTKGLSTFLNEDNVDRAIKLRGLPFRTTAANVLEFCKSNCEGLDYLQEKDVVMEVKDGKISGFALVFLKDEEEVDKALELDHKEIGTRWVGVSAAELRD